MSIEYWIFRYNWFFFSINLLDFNLFFFAHGFFHNALLHFVGLSVFLFLVLKNLKRRKEIKALLLLSLIIILGAYVYKNHDDFPYYHLTYSLNLSENSFIIGTGIFSHGFRTYSSLFYYHSLLYLPLIKFYLFHIGPFYILIFFNYIVLKKLFDDQKSQSVNFTYYFSLLGLIFVNVVFYRIGEHGTDRSAQILLILIYIIFIEIISEIKNKNNILLKINILILLIFLASSMKVIYYLYFIIIPIIFLYKKFN